MEAGLEANGTDLHDLRHPFCVFQMKTLSRFYGVRKSNGIGERSANESISELDLIKELDI